MRFHFREIKIRPRAALKKSRGVMEKEKPKIELRQSINTKIGTSDRIVQRILTSDPDSGAPLIMI